MHTTLESINSAPDMASITASRHASVRYLAVPNKVPSALQRNTLIAPLELESARQRGSSTIRTTGSNPDKYFEQGGDAF